MQRISSVRFPKLGGQEALMIDAKEDQANHLALLCHSTLLKMSADSVSVEYLRK